MPKTDNYPPSPRETLEALVHEYEKLGIASHGLAGVMFKLAIEIMSRSDGTGTMDSILEHAQGQLPGLAAEIETERHRVN